MNKFIMIYLRNNVITKFCRFFLGIITILRFIIYTECHKYYNFGKSSHYPETLGNNGLIPQYQQESINPFDPRTFIQSPVLVPTIIPKTETAKRLAEQLFQIQIGGIPSNNLEINSATKLVLGELSNSIVTDMKDIPKAIKVDNINITKKQDKKNKKYKKKRSSEKIYKKPENRLEEYFLPFNVDTLKDIKKLGEAIYTPIPIRDYSEELWGDVNYKDLESFNIKLLEPSKNGINIFRTSAECLNLYEDAYQDKKKINQFIGSPEILVTLARQAAMQLRTTLGVDDIFLLTEDVCLGLRMILYLPHPLRTQENCCNSLIAATRYEDYIEQIDKLTLSDFLDSKFGDFMYICGEVFKFPNPSISNSGVTIISPRDLFNMFNLLSAPDDLRYYNRLPLPHKKAVLKVQSSYLKHTQKTIMFDSAAAAIFLLNEIHPSDHSLMQCTEILNACLIIQNIEVKPQIDEDIAKRICEDIGIKDNNQIYPRYSTNVLLLALKRATHLTKDIDGGFLVSTKLSGDSLVSYSSKGIPERASEAIIWSQVGKVLTDGTILSTSIPICTGLMAIELNRALSLYSNISQFLKISGLSRIKLTVEDICNIAKVAKFYKIELQNLIQQKKSSDYGLDDIFPLAMSRILRNLNLEVFSFSVCKNIYKEFFEEEDIILRSVKGLTKDLRLSSFYSKPPFDYPNGFPLSHWKVKKYSLSDINGGSWKSLIDPDCSTLPHYLRNRIILFVAYLLSFWKFKMNTGTEKPIDDIKYVCIAFVNSISNSSPLNKELGEQLQVSWLKEVYPDGTSENYLEYIWKNFVRYEQSIFPIGEESEDEYIQRIYHNSLIPEPLYKEDWLNIELPTRFDLPDFLEGMKFQIIPVSILSTLDKIEQNRIKLIRAFLELFFENTYLFPITISSEEIYEVLSAHAIQSENTLDVIFYNILSKNLDRNWLNMPVMTHATYKLLEYLKYLKQNVSNQIGREATDKDIFSSSRAIFIHGCWLIKSPQPSFSKATILQMRQLKGYPKYILNKARYIQVYFLKAFERILQHELNLSIADVIKALISSPGDNEFVEILTYLLRNDPEQDFIHENIIEEIYKACKTFSYYHYNMRGALSDEQAFAASRVIYKPKIGWVFLPPNVPDFTKLIPISQIFSSHKESDDPNHIVEAYTWESLLNYLKNELMDIWRINRSISMCTFFNYWIEHFYPDKKSVPLLPKQCILATIEILKKNKKTTSNIIEVFSLKLAKNWLTNLEIKNMLSAFESYELEQKPLNMNKKQWLMNLYRIPQIEEPKDTSETNLRLPNPPKFGVLGKLTEDFSIVSKVEVNISIPGSLCDQEIENLSDFLGSFFKHYLQRFDPVLITQLDNINFKLIIEDNIKRGVNLSESIFDNIPKDHFSKGICNKIATGFFDYININFAYSNEETIIQLFKRFLSQRVITDEGYLPFDIPLGLVSGTLEDKSPYNSLSFEVVNFARLLIAYFNDDAINKNLDVLKEECVGTALKLMNSGGITLEAALKQSCSPLYIWLTPQILSMLITGFLTFCEMKFVSFPQNQIDGRSLLDYINKSFRLPIASFNKSLNTWILPSQIINSSEKINIEDKVKYSIMKTIGDIETETNTVISFSFSACDGLTVSQLNRLLAMAHYFRICTSDLADETLIFDMNVWCYVGRQMKLHQIHTLSSILTHYLNLENLNIINTKILLKSFLHLEKLWLDVSSLESPTQAMHNFYSSHFLSIGKINEAKHKNTLFCPTLITDKDISELKQLHQSRELVHRGIAFCAFIEGYLVEVYGVVSSVEKFIIHNALDNMYPISETDTKIVDAIKSVVPGISPLVIADIISAFQEFENKSATNIEQLEEYYKNKSCEFKSGVWDWIYSPQYPHRKVDPTSTFVTFSGAEINRMITFLAFFNESLLGNFENKLLGMSVSLQEVATLFQIMDRTAKNSDLQIIFYEILNDTNKFKPWLKYGVVATIIKNFLKWEKSNISDYTSTDMGTIKLPKEIIESKYAIAGVSRRNGKWLWLSWMKYYNFNSKLGQTAPAIEFTEIQKNYDEIATLFAQYFFQEVGSIIIPFNTQKIKQILSIKMEKQKFVLYQLFIKSWRLYERDIILLCEDKVNEIYESKYVFNSNGLRRFISHLPYFENIEYQYKDRELAKEIAKDMYGVFIYNKSVIHRIEALDIFIGVGINKNFKKQELEHSLNRIKLAEVFENKLHITLDKLDDQVIQSISEELYDGNEYEALKRLIQAFTKFEDDMINNGISLGLLYKKSIVLPIKDQFQFLHNLGHYMSEVK
ncbi:hypothetical protein cand_033400 [Cryptosporidium andersoni]|uniref:Uncharacterized protein n=1 Tax=Cryptosporidium andersoni TaxID=117008 RepID=A0A1J4MF04_9CRYT|nr:hypothetical protein cand_033400 [Cryptosporidium andersoni]